MITFVYGNAVSSKTDFDERITFSSEYAVGETLYIPQIKAVREGKACAVSAVLLKDFNQLAVLSEDERQKEYQFVEPGEYCLIYSAVAPDGSISQKQFFFTVKDTVYFDVKLNTLYKKGSSFSLPAEYVNGTERGPACYKTTGPDGMPLNMKEELIFNASGTYSVTYFIVLDGKNYERTYFIDVPEFVTPADYFSKNTAEDLYRLCLPLHTGDTLFYRKVRGLNSYMVETLPGDFARFLNSRYPSLSMVNSAYPFILCSLSGIMFNTPYLFMDIHERYFDLLVTRSNEVLLFNSFAYGSIPDIIYHALNCLQQCRIDLDNLQTALSGNWVNDSVFLNALQKYIPNISVLNYAPLSQWVKQNNLNNSEFIHLLNIHKCE